MTTVSITEYILLCVQHMKLRDVAIGVSLLVMLLFTLEFMQITIKGLLLIALGVACYKVVKCLINLIMSWAHDSGSTVLSAD